MVLLTHEMGISLHPKIRVNPVNACLPLASGAGAGRG